MDWDDVVDAKILGPTMSVFGTEVSYLPIVGAPFTIRGIFDKAFFGVDPTTGSTVVTNQPTLGVQLSQFSVYKPRKNDQVIIVRSGEQYVVREVHEDGHGAARLMLNTLLDEDG